MKNIADDRHSSRGCTNSKALLIALTALISLFSLIGCGYTFQGSGSILPPDVKRIYIPLVENNSTESSLTTVLTEALRDRFDRFGAVVVVEDQGSADAVLNAKIVQIKKGTSTSTSKTDYTTQQDATLTVSAELRRVTGPILWKAAKMSVSQNFGTTANSVLTSSTGFAGGTISASELANLDTVEISRGQESEVLAQMAEQLAQQIYDQAVAPDF